MAGLSGVVSDCGNFVFGCSALKTKLTHFGIIVDAFTTNTRPNPMKCQTIKAVLLFVSLFSSTWVLSQPHQHQKTAVAACNNEDFETGPGGAITTSNAVSGWSIFKYSTNGQIDNCALFTSTTVPRVNPTAAMLFMANGYIDTIIGTGYPIHSVFGSGAPNGGSAFNPSITAMYGNSFFRLGDASGTPYNHHGMEKTMMVTSSNAMFRYAYIAVVKDGFICCDAPSVRIGFLNAATGNTLLPCTTYSITSPNSICLPGVNTPSMIASTNTAAAGSYYNVWKVVAVDLSPYIGNQVTFRVVVTYCATGCGKHGYCYLDAQCAPMEILVNNVPFPAHTNSVTFSSCSAQQATVVAPPDFSSYQWSGPSGFSSTLSTITTSTNGVYTLNILTAGTCSTITKYVNIDLLTPGSVNVSSSASVICAGKPVKLTAHGLVSYNWSVPGITQAINVTPTVTTTYTVSGYTSNGCLTSAVFTQSVSQCTGILENKDANGVLVFPNPNYGEFVIRLFAPAAGSTAEVRNSLGTLVYRQSLGQEENLIHASELAPGIYYCTVVNKEQILFRTKLEIK